MERYHLGHALRHAGIFSDWVIDLSWLALQAVGMVGTTAYMSYLVSDHLGLSGIVTLFCCSVCMSHYALHSLTKTQRAATLSSFETLSYLAEGSIFVYVGLDALDPEKWAVRALSWALLAAGRALDCVAPEGSITALLPFELCGVRGCK